MRDRNRLLVLFLGIFSIVVYAHTASAAVRLGNEIWTSQGLEIEGSVVLGNASADRITLNGQLLGGSPLVFQGTTDDAHATTLSITNPTGTNTITVPDATGVLMLGSNNLSDISNSTTALANLGLASDDAVTFGSITSGADGADGQLSIYSEQGGTDYSVIFNPHSAMTQTTTYTLPANDGNAGQYLQTDGSGALTWAAGGSVAADSLDFTEFSDSLSLDADTTISASAGLQLNYEKSYTLNTAENGSVYSFTGNDLLGLTTAQYGIYYDNVASLTSGLDAFLVFDNSDTNDAVGTLFKTIDAGGGFTNIFDLGGTLLSQSELSLLDSGVALSELTDSGTLTAGTVDINGGAIDGTVIGANSAAAGTFTTVTANTSIASNGSITTGTGGTDGQLNIYSEQGLVDFTVTFNPNAAMTQNTVYTLPANDGSSGQYLQTNGSGELTWAAAGGVSADSLDFTEFADSLSLDADTTISAAATQQLNYDKSYLLNTAENGSVYSFTGNDLLGLTTAQYGMYYDNLASAVSGIDAFLVFDNSDTNDSVGAIFKTIDAGGGFTNIFDLDGTLLSQSELSLLDSGVALSELTDSGTLTAGTVDINGGAIDGTVIGANSAAAGTFTTVTANTSIASNGSITTGTGGTDGQLNIYSEQGLVDFTVTFNPNAAMTQNTVYTLPANDGSSGQYLQTNGSGALTWAAAGGVSADSLDFTEFADSLSLDADTTISAAATQQLNYDKSYLLNTAENAGVYSFTGNDLLGLTTAQYGMYYDNLASAVSGIDAFLVFDNSDTNDAVGTIFKTIDAGGGFTNIFDLGGTLLNEGELTILDSGIVLSELTDSGTLTAGTVDINGGAIDGTVIGGNSAAAGTFTALTANTSITSGGGITTGIDGADGQLTIYSEQGGTDYSVIFNPNASMTQTTTYTLPANDGDAGQYLQTDGSGALTWAAAGGSIPADSLNFSDFSDSLTLDASTTITAGENESLAYTKSFANNTAEHALEYNFLASDTGASTTEQYGMFLDNNASTEALDAFMVFNNSDTDDAIGALFKTIDAGGGFTNIFDINGTLLSVSELTLLDSGIALSELTDSGTLTAGTVDINGGAIDGTVIGANSAAAGTFTALTANTSITSGGGITTGIDGADGQLTIYSEQGGTDYSVIFNPNASMTQTTTYTLPADDGDNGEYLQTDGSGALVWASGGGGGVSADSLDFTELADALSLDADTSISAGGGQELTYNKTFTDATGENGIVFNFTASDTGAGTTSQYGIYLDNSASTEGLDAFMVFDNSDADDGVTTLFKTIDAGGGLTNIFDINGTLLSVSELTLLDSGIALSELTDSGTLTAGTVDINGGAIDGTTIGANSSAAGTFTTITASGHINVSGSTPSISSCGSGASVIGTDAAGTISAGSGAGTSCSITFATAYSNPPACVISVDASENTSVTTSTTQLTIAVPALNSLSSDNISYICIGI